MFWLTKLCFSDIGDRFFKKKNLDEKANVVKSSGVPRLHTSKDQESDEAEGAYCDLLQRKNIFAAVVENVHILPIYSPCLIPTLGIQQWDYSLRLSISLQWVLITKPTFTTRINDKGNDYDAGYIMIADCYCWADHNFVQYFYYEKRFVLIC